VPGAVAGRVVLGLAGVERGAWTGGDKADGACGTGEGLEQCATWPAVKAAIIEGCVALFLLNAVTAHAETAPLPRSKPEAEILAALRKLFPTAELDWWTNYHVNFFDGQWHRTCSLRLKPKPIRIYRCGIVHA